MKEFLRKIGLVETLTMELNIPSSVFMHNLKNIVKEAPSGLLDVFNSTKLVYKGKVDYNTFSFRRKRARFQRNFELVSITGRTEGKDNKTYIDAEISCNKYFYGFLIFLAVFYALFFIGSILALSINSDSSKMPFLFIPFIVLHGGFMYWILHSILKHSVQKFKYDIEREFFYLTKDVN